MIHLDVTAQNVLNQQSTAPAGNQIGSDASFPQVVAEEFVTGSAINVSQVIVWGIYNNDNISTADAFDVYIHSDNAGLPGAVVPGGTFTGIAPTSRTVTGQLVSGLIEHMYVLDFPPGVALAAGTYYVELFNTVAPGDGDAWGWTAGTLDAVNGVVDYSISFSAPGVAWQAFGIGGDRAIQINDPALPVELAEFTAIADGPQIRVSWTTASETNNAGFDIEVSSDRYHFERIGFVDGAGTSVESNTYHYAFEAPAPGINYVRLRQVDFDGAFEYSPILEVETEVPGGFSLLSAYPNPITSGTSANISFVVDSAVPTRLEVFDALGRPVQTLFDGLAPAGVLQTIRFDGSGLSNGMYISRLTTPLGSETHAIIIAK